MAWGTGERDARTVKTADLTAAGTMTRSLGRLRPPTYHPFGLRIQPLMRRRTIHAFPTVARVLGTAFVNAHREREEGPVA